MITFLYWCRVIGRNLRVLWIFIKHSLSLDLVVFNKTLFLLKAVLRIVTAWTLEEFLFKLL
jgi:hypothetical protein